MFSNLKSFHLIETFRTILSPLYINHMTGLQIQHLPLSLGQLSNLRWLDLKDNPLVPVLAEVVGPCLDTAQCQKAARAVVPFMQVMKEKVDAEREFRSAQRKRQKGTVYAPLSSQTVTATVFLTLDLFPPPQKWTSSLPGRRRRNSRSNRRKTKRRRRSSSKRRRRQKGKMASDTKRWQMT